MTMRVPRLPFSLDPLIAEAKRRAARRRFWIVAIVLATIGAAIVLGESGGPKSPRRGGGLLGGTAPIQVSPTGSIGPLAVGSSTRADVVRAFGPPDAENTGRYSIARPFDALGYGCTGAVATTGDGYPKCRTVFYLVRRTGKLAVFDTKSSRFAYHGVHPGTLESIAAPKIGPLPDQGCYAGYRFDTKTGSLVLWMFGGRGEPLRVGFMALVGRNDSLGVLDCIDS